MLSFWLFQLLNAILFIRPAELMPQLAGLPLYNYCMLGCLITTYPKIAEQLSIPRLTRSPITACVCGVFVMVVTSHLSPSHFSFFLAKDRGIEFFKTLLYYLLLVGVVNSAKRVTLFLKCLVFHGIVMSTLSISQYHGYLDLPGLSPVPDAETDSKTGDVQIVFRLVGPGIFNDPNDMSLLLVLLMILCAWRLTTGGIIGRLLFVPPFVLFGYGFSLTSSRGGFLALGSAMTMIFTAQFGVRRSIPLLVMALPVLIFLFAGRQTEISTDGDTGQDRIQLWNETFIVLANNPLFGCGQGQLQDIIGLVAHNSFLHSYGELGLIGGTCFVGAYWLVFLTLRAFRRKSTTIIDPDLKRLWPFLCGILAGNVTSMMSVTRTYTIPTYMILGLVTAFANFAHGAPPPRLPKLNAQGIQSILKFCTTFMILLYIFVRMKVRY